MTRGAKYLWRARSVAYNDATVARQQPGQAEIGRILPSLHQTIREAVFQFANKIVSCCFTKNEIGS
jgi:hypothetical protein